ncbi:MAG: 3-deoxy-7-phosphoheptulonate synthase [Planctomycetes bacterium]|nr:3-deoxy-7-phosphoheptulonate synthase [Planctomycetota bacterium]
MTQIQDVNVRNTVRLTSPSDLMSQFPASGSALETVVRGRELVKAVLRNEDRRLMVFVGPCSIHDPAAAAEYARRLAGLAKKVEERIIVFMRVYFEKPRTTVGWKGLINDPHLNDTFDISEGLAIARRLLIEIAQMGLPAATEMLEPITPQYIADLISVASIGARTTESPTHRQMASGLSMPVGYKNGTDGSLQVAIDAMHAARTPHSFLGIDSDGQTCIVNTKGNPWGFMILRGGRAGPNYSEDQLRAASDTLRAAKVSPRFVVDCSHGNSEKDHRKQAQVWNSVVAQAARGNDAIEGLMLESNLHEGAQKLTADLAKLKQGVSITDACIGWEETEELLLSAHRTLEGSVAAKR